MNKKMARQKARLVYIHEQKSPGCVEIFSNQDLWKIKIAHSLDSGFDIIKSFRPDAVMIDFCLMPDITQEVNRNIKGLFLKLENEQINKKLCVVAVFYSDPGAEIRSAVLGAGFDDFFIMPLLFTEFHLKMGIHIEKNDLNQRLLWKKKKLISAFEQLDKFKLEFTRIKKAFLEEKNILHNSLKQINIMTKERDKLRSHLHLLEVNFHKNVKWIENFLIRMIESRNEKNKGHSRRVAEIAEFVARGFGLNKKDKIIVKKAGLLHELGLLFVPDSVFFKDDENRSNYEKDMIFHSPVRGADFLSQCKGFERVAEVIRSLNENVDGSGFPDGLKRRYIPVLSRIVAGADMLDNLLNENFAISVDDIFAKLEAMSGERLDPSVINYLERYVVICLNKGKEKMKEVGLYQLKPGMRTGAGLFTSTGTKLFSAGTVLTDESIEMVVKYNRAYPVDETIIIKVE